MMRMTVVVLLLLSVMAGVPLCAEDRPEEKAAGIRDAVAKLAAQSNAEAGANQRIRRPRRPPVRRGRDSLWNGAILGAIGGAAMGVYACREVPNCPTFKMAAYIGVIGGFAGAAVDAQH